MGLQKAGPLINDKDIFTETNRSQLHGSALSLTTASSLTEEEPFKGFSTQNVESLYETTPN
jgi:hypothetical protein